jgi:hypothetical protein
MTLTIIYDQVVIQGYKGEISSPSKNIFVLSSVKPTSYRLAQ